MSVGAQFPEVLAAARAGAAWGFETLYRDLAPTVTGYLRLHGAAEPDDLASETFLAVFTALKTFDGDEASLRRWVFTIAHRRLLDDWRRRSRRPATVEWSPGVEAVHAGGDVEDEALAGLATGAVLDVCASLPDDQRTVLLLRILGELTVAEVADAMERSTAAVKALQRRALLTLRGELEHSHAPSGLPPAMTRTR